MWNLCERSKERSLFQSGFSLLLLWRFLQIQSPSPFSPVCACCLSELLEGITRRRKKAEMCHRPWLPVPISRRIDPAEEEQKGRFKTGKKKQERKQKGHTFRFGLGVEDGWSKKCGPKNDVFFFLSAAVDLQLGLDGEGVVVRSCLNPSLMSKTKTLPPSPGVLFVCFLRVLVCLLPAINFDQR